MSVTMKTATAMIALTMAMGGYPMVSMAQSQTTEESVDQAVETIEEGTQEAVESIEQGAAEAVESVEQGADQAADTEADADAAAATDTDADAAATDTTADEAATADEATDTSADATTEGATADDATAMDADTATETDAGDAAMAEGEPTPPEGMVMGAQSDDEWLSTDIVGSEVRNPQGEVIGDVSAILFDEQGPSAVIVGVGGFLGIGQKDVAVNWSELSIAPEGILVTATAEQLTNAPAFVTKEDQREQAEEQARELEAQQQQGMGGATTGMGGTAGGIGATTGGTDGSVEQ